MGGLYFAFFAYLQILWRLVDCSMEKLFNTLIQNPSSSLLFAFLSILNHKKCMKSIFGSKNFRSQARKTTFGRRYCQYRTVAKHDFIFKFSTRLERLLLLLENATSSVTRLEAARQLGTRSLIFLQLVIYFKNHNGSNHRRFSDPVSGGRLRGGYKTSKWLIITY